MRTITQKALSIGAMAAFPFNGELLDLCTFKIPFPKDGEPDSICLAKRDGGILYVPRNMAKGGYFNDFRTTPVIGSVPCAWGPRDADQARVYDECLDLLEDGVSHVVEAPTGWGKTWLGVAIGCKLGYPTLIGVTKNDLVKQWHTTLIGCGIKPDEIGHVQADKCDYVGKRFVIGMVHSLCKAERYEPGLYKAFGLIIFDETHRMAAESFVEMCSLYPALLRLGLSATPKRADGKTFVLDHHIGPLMVKGVVVPMRPKILVEKTGWNIPLVTRKVNGDYRKVEEPHSAGRMMGVLKHMCLNVYRNRRIAKFCKTAYDKHRTTLVVSAKIDHLKLLFQQIVEAGVPGEDIGYYVGGMSETALKQNAHRRVILATYKMVSEGTDYPHWDTGVAATPVSNIEQTLGRIIRKREGKAQPVWLDLVDNGAVLQGFANKRLAYFYKLKADIVQIKQAA